MAAKIVSGSFLPVDDDDDGNDDYDRFSVVAAASTEAIFAAVVASLVITIILNKCFCYDIEADTEADILIVSLMFN